EARLADGADGDHLAHVAAALDRGREGVEHGREPRVGPAYGTVHHDPYVVGERCPKRLLQEVGGAGRLGRLARASAEGEDLLDTARPRRTSSAGAGGCSRRGRLTYRP